MFATIAGGYNRKPLPGLPDTFGDAERAFREGRLDAAGYTAAADAYVEEILKEMAVVELAVVGDGGVRGRDRVVPWIEGLAGLASGGEVVLPGGEPATRPVVTAPVRWVRPVTVRDWEFVADHTDRVPRQTLLGPYTLASLAEPQPGRARADLAVALAEALNQELVALTEAGCPMVEIDEPLALGIGDAASEWRSFRAAHDRLTAGLVGDDAPHLSLGLWGSEIDPAGHRDLIDLPYQSYLVDVLAGPSAWRFIAAVPPELGIIVGSADAATEHLDETEVHVWAMAWASQGDRGSVRVGCAPNGSLVSLGRHFAHRKCYRLGEAVRVAAIGPLLEVAEALDEHPARSKMPELRAMAQAVEAGRRS